MGGGCVLGCVDEGSDVGRTQGLVWREDGEKSVVDDGDDGGSGTLAQPGLDNPSRMVGPASCDRIYILSIFAPLVPG
jgi:hypothetical protein